MKRALVPIVALGLGGVTESASYTVIGPLPRSCGAWTIAKQDDPAGPAICGFSDFCQGWDQHDQ